MRVNVEKERSEKELKKKKKKKKKLDEKDDGSTGGKKKQYADDNVEKKKKKRKKNIKVFDLPGQKRDPPNERDPLRIFYETLYKHNPNSEMAQIWMMESGLLSREEAEKIHTMKQSKSQQKIAEVASSSNSTKSVSLKRKKASI